MQRISRWELSADELAILEFHIAAIGCTTEDEEFIYNNLFRDGNGVAYCPSRNREKLLAIYTD